MMRERDIRDLADRVQQRLADDDLSARERARWEGVLTALQIILEERFSLAPGADAWAWAVSPTEEARVS
jgi:hypothetical protein